MFPHQAQSLSTKKPNFVKRFYCPKILKVETYVEYFPEFFMEILIPYEWSNLKNGDF